MKRGDKRDGAQAHWQQNRNKTLLLCYFIWPLTENIPAAEGSRGGEVGGLGVGRRRKEKQGLFPFLSAVFGMTSGAFYMNSHAWGILASPTY